MDSNWNNHYILAEIEVCLSLRFVFSVSLETDEIIDFEVENETELWGYCRGCGAIEGSRPILVTSGEAWYLPYCNTEETRTAMP